MAPLARLGGISIDCADPRALAAFYRELTGWGVSYDSDGYVFLEPGDGAEGQAPGMGFQRVAQYQPPKWPDGAPAQAHLDFYVENMAEAAERLEALGATKASLQPGEGRWLVYLDPAGHPFCITVPGAFDEESASSSS